MPLRFLTAGESHGPALTVIVDGLPADVPIDRDRIDRALQRRMGGFGRGGRMKIENDRVTLLGGVRVGVVGSNQEVYSNAEGSFSITGLTDGRYQVRFVDARLESMGYIPPPVERDVIRGEMSLLEYFTPSVGDVLFEACQGVEREQGSVLLAGSVVDDRGRPVPEATVQVRWTGYTTAGGGDVSLAGGSGADGGRSFGGNIREDVSGFSTTASASGFFKFCGVPANTRLAVSATVGDVVSDEFELQISDFETGMMTIVEIGND